MARFTNQSESAQGSTSRYLVVSGADTSTGDSGGGFNNTTSNFSIVPLNNIEAESHPGLFDPATYKYTVAETGAYEISGHMRIRDTSNYDANWRIANDSQGTITYTNQQWGYGTDTSSDRTFIINATVGDEIYMEFRGLFYDSGSMVIKKVA